MKNHHFLILLILLCSCLVSNLNAEEVIQPVQNNTTPTAINKNIVKEPIQNNAKNKPQISNTSANPKPTEQKVNSDIKENKTSKNGKNIKNGKNGKRKPDTDNQDKKSSEDSKTQKTESVEDKTLQYFESVNLSGAGDLYIKQSEKPSFTIEGEKSLLPMVSVYVKEKVLYIDLKNSNANVDNKLKYHLEVKDLKNIQSFSSSNIFINEAFKTDELNVSINGFGEAHIFINVRKFTTKLEGGGKITAKGLAADQEIIILGAGEFNGAKLFGQNAFITASGSGMLKTNVADALNATITGDAVIKYCGMPKITRQIIGKGAVTAATVDECK